MRLGRRDRVVDVDPTATLALIATGRWLRLFDLRRLRWAGGLSYPYSMSAVKHDCHPRLTGGGRQMLYPELTHIDGIYSGICLRTLVTDVIDRISSSSPSTHTAMSATGDLFYFITDQQQVVVLGPATEDHYDPLPRKVVHTAHVDADRQLLAAGSWSEVALHRMVDGGLERVGYAKTALDGNVTWLAVAGPWLVAAIGERHYLEVRRLDHDLSIGDVVYRHRGVEVAGLSRDGRYLAFANAGAKIVIHELDTDDRVEVETPSKRVDLVRFGGDDHVLVVADQRGRIVLRPRTPNGYAHPLIAIDVPPESIPLPSRDVTST